MNAPKEKGALHTPPCTTDINNNFINSNVFPCTLNEWKVVSGVGQYHTNKNSVQNPKPYIPMHLAEIAEMIEYPPSTNKIDAKWVIFSTLFTRIYKEQRESGEFVALWADFDIDPRPLNQIVAAWRQIGGHTMAWFYTTASATMVKPKSRLIVPLSKPIDGETFSFAQQVINDAFERIGLKPDRASEKAGQLCYLPNSGEFYDWRKTEGELLDIYVFNSDIAVKRALKITAINDQFIEREKRAQVIQKRSEELRTNGAASNLSPIEWFNETHYLDDVLGEAGYDSDTKNPDAYRHPNSQSGNYSARVWRNADSERVSTLSSEDPLYMTSGSAHDCFSAWCILHHQGDEETALKAAIKLRKESCFDFIDVPSVTLEQNFSTGIESNTNRNPIATLELEAEAEMPSIEAFKGIMSEFVQAVHNTAPRQQLMLTVGAALVGMASSVPGIYRLPDGLRMNLYVLGVAPTASGKDHPRSCAEKLAVEAGAAFMGYAASAQGLEDSLPTHERPTQGLLASVDEIGHFLGDINDPKASTHTKQIAGILLRLYSVSNGMHPKRSLAKTPNTVYRNPTLSLLGFSTPEKLGRTLGIEAIEDGLLGRMLMVQGQAESPLRNVSQEFELPSNVRDACLILKNQIRMSGHNIVVQISPEALQSYELLAKEFETTDGDSMVGALHRRSAEKAKRVAGVLAVWDNPKQPTIGLEHIDWASRFVNYSNSTLVQFAQNGMHTDQIQADAARILMQIKRIANRKLSGSRPNELTAVKSGWVPRRLALQHSRLNADRFDRAIRHLIALGDIEEYLFKDEGKSKGMAVFKLGTE